MATATAQEVAVQKINTVRAELEKQRELIVQSMSKYLDPVKMMSVFMITVQRNPDLLDCTRESLFGALITAARLGLEIESTTNQAVILPFKGKATLIPGYKGLETLAMRTGLVHRIVPRVVYEGDEFEYSYGINPTIHAHNPKHISKKLAYVYAVVYYLNGTTDFRVMDAKDMEAIKKRSPAFNAGSGPWLTDEANMWCKTAVRQTCKIVPNTSPDGDRLHKAVALDERFEIGLPQNLHLELDPTAKPDPEKLAAPPVEEPKRKSEKAPEEAKAAATVPASAPNPNANKTSRDNMRVMPTRFPGTCQDCLTKIPKGTNIYYNPDNKKPYCHPACS